ncbi:hypothetical protein [Actinomycetospora flava]|uniref:Uncharacterized protein n=1 Tax=Actinomycetospora flava TaxID=3129232 RepID=A0ABU8MFY6_9PSEU
MVDFWQEPDGPGEIALASPFRRVYVDRRGLARGVSTLSRGQEVQVEVREYGQGQVAVNVSPLGAVSGASYRDEPALETEARAERYRADAARTFRSGESATRIDEAAMHYMKAQYLMSCAIQVELREIASLLRGDEGLDSLDEQG